MDFVSLDDIDIKGCFFFLIFFFTNIFRKKLKKNYNNKREIENN